MKISLPFYLLLHLLLFFGNGLMAQEFKVIDKKGTIISITSNSVTVSSTEPASNVEGDVWYDKTQSENVLKIYDGSAWEEIKLNTFLGYRTVYHNSATSTLQINHSHHNADIHIKDSGNLSISAPLPSAAPTSTTISDRTNFYVTNTTENPRTLTVLGFNGVFMRNGGQIVNLVNNTPPTSSIATVTIKGNTRYEINITLNSGSYFANITHPTAEKSNGSKTIYFEDANFHYISGLNGSGEWFVWRSNGSDTTTANQSNNATVSSQPNNLILIQGLNYN